MHCNEDTDAPTVADAGDESHSAGQDNVAFLESRLPYCIYMSWNSLHASKIHPKIHAFLTDSERSSLLVCNKPTPKALHVPLVLHWLASLPNQKLLPRRTDSPLSIALLNGQQDYVAHRRHSLY